MFTVTDMAAEKFREMAVKTSNPDAQMLRISFAGYGWGGPKLGLALDEQKKEDDLMISDNDVKVVYPKELESYVDTENLTLDYEDKWYNKGFQLSGNNSGSCR